MTRFDTDYIQEPQLRFGNGEAEDPRGGLMEHGPWSPGGSASINEIKIGFIGTSQSIGASKQLFREMETVIPRDNDDVIRHKPPFPSMGENSPFRAVLNMQPKWEDKLDQTDLEIIQDEPTPSGSVSVLLEIMQQRIEWLSQQDPPPKVVVISLPAEVVEACSPSGVDRPKMKAGSIDFHDRIKTFGLQFDLPTQLIRPDTLDFGRPDQEKAQVAWNLAVALLYKSREGRPWKLAHLENDTCYAGISFYRDRDRREKAHASLAQVFLGTGESFVLRGDPAVKDEESRNYHLTKDSAEEIVEQILNQYERYRGTSPRRLVLHKTTKFDDEEREGFISGSDSVAVRDFVTIRDTDPVRFYASGQYPPLRGTVVTPRGASKHYLYTKGYVPTLETYPGPRVPSPITVEPDSEVCETSYIDLCEEILSFTKMDWNTSAFAKKKPVTIKVARAVGAILAESERRGIRVKPQYYYYM